MTFKGPFQSELSCDSVSQYCSVLELKHQKESSTNVTRLAFWGNG